MALEDAVKAALDAVETVSGHVYAAEALRDDPHPFAFWRIGRVSEDACLDSWSGLYEADAEIHLVGRSMEDVVRASGELEVQVKALQGETVEGLRVEQVELRQQSPDLKEMLVGLFRRMYSLTIWYQKVEDGTAV